MLHVSVVRCASNQRSVSSLKSDAPYGEPLIGGPNENESVPGRAAGNKPPTGWRTALSDQRNGAANSEIPTAAIDHRQTDADRTWKTFRPTSIATPATATTATTRISIGRIHPYDGLRRSRISCSSSRRHDRRPACNPPRPIPRLPCADRADPSQCGDRRRELDHVVRVEHALGEREHAHARERPQRPHDSGTDQRISLLPTFAPHQRHNHAEHRHREPPHHLVPHAVVEHPANAAFATELHEEPAERTRAATDARRQTAFPAKDTEVVTEDQAPGAAVLAATDPRTCRQRTCIDRQQPQPDKPDEHSRRRSGARHALQPATFSCNQISDPDSGYGKSNGDGLGEKPGGRGDTDHDRPAPRRRRVAAYRGPPGEHDKERQRHVRKIRT